MQDFIGKKIVLGMCGGIAAYKSGWLVRELARLGAQVRVVMTDSAREFISPLTMQALSGNEVRNALFDQQAERAMGHIELARWADFIVIAPASANCLAKLAQGLADDLLSTLYLVAEVPVIVCPAMNHSMWHHPATVANCAVLRQRGVIFVGPEEGSQACGEYGLGRVSDADSIINALRLQAIHGLLVGEKVLITAGPTREAIDPVRFISNHSSGKMGYALAAAAHMAGADVTLVSGPVALEAPAGVKTCKVVSAKEMYDQVMAQLSPGDIFIACAAVADYAPQKVAANKLKKQAQEEMTLHLTLNPDILAAVASSGKASYVVGFAAETDQVLTHAHKKLKDKKLDMIIANKVGDGMGFDQDGNEVTVLTQRSEQVLPFDNKVRLAGQVIAILATNRQNAGQTKHRTL